MTATTSPARNAPASTRSTPGALAVALAALAAFLLLVGGALLAIHVTQRDDGGYYTSSRFRLAAPGYAITSQQLDLAGGGTSSLAKDAAALSGSLRVRASSTNGRPIFVGIARQPDADRYLGGVARDEVVDAAGGASETVSRPGVAPSGPPQRRRIWAAASSGSGPRTMTWKIRPGRWTVVVMNADAARAVGAELIVGLKTSLFLWVGLAALAAAVLAAGAAVWRVISRRSGRGRD